MRQAQTSTARSHGRFYGTLVMATALVTAISLGGCADLSGPEASNAPYQVAGPVVAKGPAQTDKGCVADVSQWVNVCDGFAHYVGP